MTVLNFLTVGASPSRRIAYLKRDGEPAFIWMHGFYSSMEGLKANALDQFALHNNYGFTRFDLSAHGRSEGDPLTAVLSDWLEESQTVFVKLTSGPQVIVASSMGAWLALRLAQTLKSHAQSRIKALILIAPAWDMTEKMFKPQITPEIRTILDRDGVYYRPSAYEEVPQPITKKMIEDGQRHLLTQTLAHEPLPNHVPIHILHGKKDPDVRWQNSLELKEIVDRHFNSDHVRIDFVPDGDHRLSRPRDLLHLKQVIASYLTAADS